MPLFIVKSPGTITTPYEWSAEGVITIGRASLNEICISDPAVSAVHAEVRSENGQYLLHDLGSINGTYYDGRFVSSPVALSPGGRIYLGSTEIEVQDVLADELVGLTIWPVSSFNTKVSSAAGSGESTSHNLLVALGGLDVDTDWLAPVLFQRAARYFEASGLLREAAGCWIEAGNTTDAIEIYLRTNEYAKAAPLLLDKGRYREALTCYRNWLATLKTVDVISRMRALLGVAVCLNAMQKEPDAADAAWREARSLAEAPKRDQLVAGACWEELGAYGARIGRNDLVQVGYEQALQNYGSEFNQERTIAAQNYLAAVQHNRLLVAEIETKLAEWNPQVEELTTPSVDAGHTLVMGARFGDWTVWRPGMKEVVIIHAESSTAIQIWADSVGWFRWSRGKDGYQVSSDGSITGVGPIRIKQYVEKAAAATLRDVAAEVANYVFVWTKEHLRITNKVRGGIIMVYPQSASFEFTPKDSRTIQM